MNFFIKAFFPCMLALPVFTANASVVTFVNGLSTSFADGTFSSFLSGGAADGFYEATSPTSAYNRYAFNNEYISFNSPVQFNSLELEQCSVCAGNLPGAMTISLYDAANNFLGSQTLTSLTTTYQTLTFDTDNVSKILFTDSKTVGYYMVNDITYSANPASDPVTIPEPASLSIFGLGLLGFFASRKRLQ